MFSMSAGPLQQILSFLDRLGARERRLLAVEVAAQAGAVLLGGMAATGLALSLGAAPVWGRVLLCAAIGAALGPPALRLLRSWAAVADRRSLAQRIEALRPELRSRLITAVERGALSAEQAAHISVALLERATAKAAAIALSVPPEEAAPARAARRAGQGLLLSGLLAVLVGLLFPIGPLDALGVLLGGSPAAARVHDEEIPLSEERVLVGNIDLRYIYPSFTGLEPLEVPATDGSIHAPPGTVVEISAQVGDAYEGVALQVGDGPLMEASLRDGRHILARLVVEGDGTWRFVFVRGEQRFLSPDYTIESEADAAPVVSTSRFEAASRALDEPLGLRWSAQDDYGLGTISLEITDAAGQTRTVELRAPVDQPRDLRGGVRATPRELGLKIGDKVTLKVVATDVPPQGSAQRGESKPVTLTIAPPRSSGKNLLGYRTQVIEALIPLLADFLEEPVPPAEDPAGMKAWAGKARTRLEPLAALHKKQWGSEPSEAMEAKVVAEVLDQSGKLLRFTVTTWDGEGGGRQTEADFTTFAELHGAVVKSLENGVYLLDMMNQQVALQELAEAANKVAAEARELANLPDNADAAQILAQLDQLERQMAALAKAASKLKGNLGEFVNSQMNETRALMDEVRKAVAAGKLDEARQLLEQLSDQMQRMAENINDQMTQKGEQDNALGEALKKVMSDLEALEKDQRDLAQKLDSAREKAGGGLDRQLDLWKKADVLAAKAAERSAAAESAVGDGAGWRTGSITWIGRLAQGAAGVADAVAARDGKGGLERIARLAAPMRMSASSTAEEASRRRPAGEAPPADLAGATKAVTEANSALRELQALLEQLAEQEKKDPPEVQQLARQLAKEQAELKQRQEGLSKEVQRVERAMPTGDGKAAEAMKGAGEAMERAEDALQQGEAAPGSSHQRDAANRVAEARDRLQQQAEQMQQAQQQAQGEGEGSQNRDKGEEQGSPSAELMELPDPEDFQTPEEYRRALLEGMRGDVPDEFEALKKRYFEELVRQ